jgi:hypothetical protein
VLGSLGEAKPIELMSLAAVFSPEPKLILRELPLKVLCTGEAGIESKRMVFCVMS